jgi:hypothetical protein
MMGTRRLVTSVAVFLALVAAFAGGGYGRPTHQPRPSGEPRFLEVTVEGDSVDFVMVDPAGRVAVLAVDGTECAIPDCFVRKASDLAMEDHDDSDTTASDTNGVEYPAYGGGYFSLDNPAPGTWYVEARAERECPDSYSCAVAVRIMSVADSGPSPAVLEDSRSSLRTGESVRWRLTIGPRSKQIGKAWAHVRLVSGPTKRR